MKKILSLLTLLLCIASGAWATEEEISLVSYTVENNIATLTSESGDATVILSMANGNAVNGADNKGRGFRWQKTRVITVTVPTGQKINSVKLTSNSNGNNLGDIQYTLTDGTNSLSGSWDYAFTAGKREAYTWSATPGTSYNTWVLTNSGSNGDIYISKVTVNYEAASTEASAPTILTQPASTLDAYVGYEASLTAAASGYPAPTYQWYSNTTASNQGGTAIEGATAATYTFTPAATGTYYYYVVATNSEGSVTSNVSTVTVGLKYKVSYAAGESGATFSKPLETADYVGGTEITLPTNKYFYLEGKSVSKWSDGTSEYALGATYTVNSDVTFYPVFADNTKALGDEETSITWTFRRDQGAPSYAVEGENVTTSVIGTTGNGIDLKLDVLLLKNGDKVGKFNNTSDLIRAQVNAYSTFTIPAIAGMVVKYTTTSGELSTDDEVLFGEDHATSIDGKHYVYTYDGSDETLTITENVGNHYPTGITVTYPTRPTKTPAPTITVGDFSFASKGYPVTITSENTLYVSTDGVNYTEQTSPYETTATSTTTFYAKATATGLEDSEVASKEVVNNFDAEKKFIAWVYTKGYGSASYAFATDPMVIELQKTYNVVEINNAAEVAPSADLANADLIVCTEAMTGNKNLSNGMKNFVGTTPMIGLKAFNYTKGRWSWGTPSNPSPARKSFTPKSVSYNLFDGVVFESDGTIKLATAESGNVIQTVEFGTTDCTAPEGNIILGTLDGDDAKAVMYTSTKFFGLGLSSDCWATYTDNAITIVKNAAALLIAGEDLTAEGTPNTSIVATITTADYATFVPVQKVAVPDGVEAYIVKAITEKAAIFEPVSVIPANTPVIIYQDVNADTEVTFEPSDAEADDVTLNKLEYSDEAIAANGQYILANGEDGVGFYKATTGTIAARKAYLPASANANFLSFSFDGDATGIEKVENAAVNANGTMFNLAGQRVAQPTKGLYIVNGKKVVVK